MQRAAVLIGVRKTGLLPALPAAQSAARNMAQWALTQGIPPARVSTILDDSEPVTVSRIRKAIRLLADTLVVEQLLIYFCGHGIYSRSSELWLLSEAPDTPEEAVNLAGSVDLARQGVFPHVVFISDACRTAAVGLQFQQVTGSSIFTNPGIPPDEEPSVDQFFACTLNTSSNQTRDPAIATAPFNSIFTSTLIQALNGDFQEALCVGQSDDHSARRRVHPWPLKNLLRAKVPEAIQKAGLPHTAFQTPDARICSAPTAWVSDLSPLPIPEPPRAQPDLGGLLGALGGSSLTSSITSSGGGLDLGGISVGLSSLLRSMNRLIGPVQAAPAPPPSPLKPPPMDTVLSLILKDSGHDAYRKLEALADEGLNPADQSVKLHAGYLVANETPTESHFESGMGARIHGATLAHAIPLSLSVERIDQSPDAAIVWSNLPTANVLLIFSDGTGTVLPVIAGFIVNLTFYEEELVSVSYEPMDPSARTDPHLRVDEGWRWHMMKDLARVTRENRALVASMTHAGTFRLDAGTAEEAENAERLGRMLQSTKTYDPSMAVYSAYAYYDIQRIDLILKMADYFISERGLMLFDLALLTRSLTLAGAKTDDTPVFPAFPMLARGWALMASSAIQLPPRLQGLERHVTESLWTLFDPQGVAIIQDHATTLESHNEAVGFSPRQVSTRQRAR